jgi:hypothetical protein
MEFRADNKVYLVPGNSDLRKQINGLSNIVQRLTKSNDLFDGNYYMFCNKKRNIVKMLFWDFDDFALYQKKCENKGEQFHWFEGKEKRDPMNIGACLANQILHYVNIWNKVTLNNKERHRVRPSKAVLDKVIKERKSSGEYNVKPGYIDNEYGKTEYVDTKGLIHKDGPDGEVVDFIGLTGEQKERIEKMKKDGKDSLDPMPR